MKILVKCQSEAGAEEFPYDVPRADRVLGMENKGRVLNIYLDQGIKIICWLPKQTTYFNVTFTR